MRKTAVTVAQLLLMLFLLPKPSAWATEPASAADEAVEVALGQTADGIQQIFRRCFVELREAGHDPERMSESEISGCMRPEVEAMAEFAYEIATGYSVSSLTRIAVETCVTEQGNALSARRKDDGGGRSSKLTWRWLADCVKEVRWLDHDEQAARLERVRREARKLESGESEEN